MFETTELSFFIVNNVAVGAWQLASACVKASGETCEGLGSNP
jgi:hypothetical protein